MLGMTPVVAVVAVVAAYLMSGLDEGPPPGCAPVLRRHRRAHGPTCCSSSCGAQARLAAPVRRRLR